MGIERLLSQRNITATANRLLVLQYMVAQHTAVSLKMLEAAMPRMERSTIYRTLKTFEVQKLIHAIDDGTGITKYGLCATSCDCALHDQHLHFHCLQCERTTCMKDRIALHHLPGQYEIESAHLVLKGRCADCN